MSFLVPTPYEYQEPRHFRVHIPELTHEEVKQLNAITTYTLQPALTVLEHLLEKDKIVDPDCSPLPKGKKDNGSFSSRVCLETY